MFDWFNDMIDGLNKEEPVFSISSAARMLGVSVHTLRLYEREGLIIPYKKQSSHRLYCLTDIERLKCIRSAIKDKKYSIPAIRTMFSFIPCWDIVGCSAEERQSCQAYTGNSSPCWTYRHSDNTCQKRDCRQCIVYQKYSSCEEIKNGIKNISVIQCNQSQGEAS